MKSRILFLIFFVMTAIFGVIAFAPFPNNPFSLRRLWQQTGLEDQEASRRQLIEQRKKAASKILQQKIQAIEQDRRTLMENRSDSVNQSKGILKQSMTPEELRQIEQQKAQELRDLQQQRMQDLRDRMNDLRDAQNNR